MRGLARTTKVFFAPLPSQELDERDILAGASRASSSSP
jgi:hypothetical protein